MCDGIDVPVRRFFRRKYDAVRTLEQFALTARDEVDLDRLAAELVGRFEIVRKGLAATALTANTSVLTAVSNDFGYDGAFARQIEALGRPGDLAFAISKSGESPNVVTGVKAARESGLPVVALTGTDGGELAGLVDLCICVPSRSAARIQEAHRLIIHTLCALVEDSLQNIEFPPDSI